MDIKRSGSQPSSKGLAEYFTGTVRIDPLFEAHEPRLATSSMKEDLNAFEMVSHQGEKLAEENPDRGSRSSDVPELLSLPCRQQDA